MVKKKKKVADAERPRVVDFLDEVMADLRMQLESDEERYGDTWLRRPRAGQTMRTICPNPKRGPSALRQYWDQFLAGNPVDWLEVMGNPMVCYVREKYPDLSPAWEEPDRKGK